MGGQDAQRTGRRIYHRLDTSPLHARQLRLRGPGQQVAEGLEHRQAGEEQIAEAAAPDAPCGGHVQPGSVDGLVVGKGRGQEGQIVLGRPAGQAREIDCHFLQADDFRRTQPRQHIPGTGQIHQAVRSPAPLDVPGHDAHVRAPRVRFHSSWHRKAGDAPQAWGITIRKVTRTRRAAMAHAHSHDHHHDHPHHSHDEHDHHGHAQGGHHHHAPPTGRLLGIALALTLCFAFVEAGAGWWAGSLALLGDAGHMLTDSMALGLAAIASVVAKRPPSPRHSYGLGRVEALAALVNGAFMLGVVGWITWQAVSRLIHPVPVHGEAVSVVALAAGLMILATGWTPIDPLLSMLISGLILASTLRLLRTVLSTLLEGVPEGVSLAEIGQAMAAVPGVLSVHDLHIWSLASHQTALSAHVVMGRQEQWPRVLLALRALLASRYGIAHSTLQPELPGENFISMPVPGSRNNGAKGQRLGPA